MNRAGSALRRVAAMIFALTTVAADLPAQTRTSPQALLRTSPHDLRDTVLRRGTDDSATCVFCHTPQGHRAESMQPPQWQVRGTQADAFRLYGVTGAEAQDAGGGASSVLCLSCHDALQAQVVGGLTYDHPFGVPYAGLSPTLAPLREARAPQTSTLPTALRQFSVANLEARAHALRQTPTYALTAGSGFRAASRAVIDQRPVWWVATSANSARRNRSDLPLYSSSADEQQDVPTVECATCHDPHGSNDMFLRISNQGSRLCLSCHDQ